MKREFVKAEVQVIKYQMNDIITGSVDGIASSVIDPRYHYILCFVI